MTDAYTPKTPMTPMHEGIWATIEPKNERNEAIMHLVTLGLLINTLPAPPEAKRALMRELENVRETTVGSILGVEDTAVAGLVSDGIAAFMQERMKEARLDSLRNLILPPGVKRN